MLFTAVDVNGFKSDLFIFSLAIQEEADTLPNTQEGETAAVAYNYTAHIESQKEPER